MKTRHLTLGILLTANLIVLSLVVPVNHSSSPAIRSGTVLVADGDPGPGLPPPPPPPNQNIGTVGVPLSPAAV